MPGNVRLTEIDTQGYRVGSEVSTKREPEKNVGLSSGELASQIQQLHIPGRLQCNLTGDCGSAFCDICSELEIGSSTRVRVEHCTFITFQTHESQSTMNPQIVKSIGQN